jgi:RNA polymerase sigma-70 factor, ECF subfamily
MHLRLALSHNLTSWRSRVRAGACSRSCMLAFGFHAGSSSPDPFAWSNPATHAYDMRSAARMWSFRFRKSRSPSWEGGSGVNVITTGRPRSSQPASAACSTFSTELIKQFEKRQREDETLIPNVSFGEQMVSTLPSLRAFALSLVHDPVRADDLVQETILRAWSKAHLFEPGMNLRSWLFTTLRHQFCSELRKRKREIDDPNGFYARRLRACPDQHAHLEWKEFQTALAKLTPDQRAALILVAAEGLSHEDAAAVCGVCAGTIKSRVSRARTRLAELLRIDDHTQIGPDNLTKAALQRATRL